MQHKTKSHILVGAMIILGISLAYLIFALQQGQAYAYYNIPVVIPVGIGLAIVIEAHRRVSHKKI